MTSTFLGYATFARNLTQSLQHVADEPTNKASKAYFDANIGKVRTVDEFVNNYRLFSYAMTAYGLTDMTYAKGLMKQVLTSNLSDSSSVANRLSDSRYLAFAKAFSFTTTGAVATTSVQTASQQSTAISLYATNATAAGVAAGAVAAVTASAIAKATAYYQSTIGSITSLAALNKDPKLTSFLQTAYGIDPTASTSSVNAIIESSLSDSTSALNETAGAGYLALEQAFKVNSSGSAVTSTTPAQSATQIQATVTAYVGTIKGDAASRSAASIATSYYQSQIANVTSVSGLLADSHLTAYVLKAYGLPSSTSSGTLRQILTSDPADPHSFVNQYNNPKYNNVAAAFSFAADGSLKSTTMIQTDAQQQSTTALYTARFKSDTVSLDQATQYYQSHIGSVQSVSALQSDSELYSYVLKAYGIDASASNATVASILEQSPTATSSVVALTAGSKDLALSLAFTVDKTGAATDTLQAQSPAAVTAMVSAYTTAVGTGTAAQAGAKKETQYYQTAIQTVPSIDALVGDRRLVAYIVKASGLPATTTASQLKQVLTSDLASSSSAANRLGPAYQKAAVAFNFGTNGLLAHQTVQSAQSKAQRAATDAAFTQASLETEAGQQNTGIQLALYFQRVAPTITNSYQILADKALTQVFQTLLGLPAASAQANVDSQASFLTRKINFTDLQDPAKVTKMVQRFAAMYDLANPDTTASDNFSSLFGSGTSSSSTTLPTLTVPTS